MSVVAERQIAVIVSIPPGRHRRAASRPSRRPASSPGRRVDTSWDLDGGLARVVPDEPHRLRGADLGSPRRMVARARSWRLRQAQAAAPWRRVRQGQAAGSTDRSGDDQPMVARHSCSGGPLGHGPASRMSAAMEWRSRGTAQEVGAGSGSPPWRSPWWTPARCRRSPGRRPAVTPALGDGLGRRRTCVVDATWTTYAACGCAVSQSVVTVSAARRCLVRLGPARASAAIAHSRLDAVGEARERCRPRRPHRVLAQQDGCRAEARIGAFWPAAGRR
jgi:hypothetical protein